MSAEPESKRLMARLAELEAVIHAEAAHWDYVEDGDVLWIEAAQGPISPEDPLFPIYDRAMGDYEYRAKPRFRADVHRHSELIYGQWVPGYRAMVYDRCGSDFTSDHFHGKGGKRAAQEAALEFAKTRSLSAAPSIKWIHGGPKT